MTTGFPHGFQFGFLSRSKVSRFLCGNSHMETRKLFAQNRVNIGNKWFPPSEIFPGQETHGFHFGFLMEGSL